MPTSPNTSSKAHQTLERGVQFLFPHLMRSSVKKGLRGVWLRGEMPSRGVIAANHHSWWDGYLAAELAWSHGLPMRGLMTDDNLERMPFFRLLGAVGASEVRASIRVLEGGEPLFIFPEGQVSPQGKLQKLHSGAEWLAKKSRVPLYPMALRCVLRGQQLPEAYLWIGKPTLNLEPDLSAMLNKLDFDLEHHDPERELPGFSQMVHGPSSAQESTEFLSKMLKLALEKL